MKIETKKTMARHNLRKLNQSIMMGVMGMAVVVLLVILLFWYLCMKQITPQNAEQEDTTTEQIDGYDE